MENVLISKELHSDIMVFQLPKMYSCEAVGKKVFVSQGWVQAKITVHAL